MKPDEYKIILPNSSRGIKEFKILLERRKKQTNKAIDKLRDNPTDLSKQGIEKLQESQLGDYSIRVSKGDRIFYDVNLEKKEVILLRAGKHDLYRLFS